MLDIIKYMWVYLTTIRSILNCLIIGRYTQYVGTID